MNKQFLISYCLLTVIIVLITGFLLDGGKALALILIVNIYAFFNIVIFNKFKKSPVFCSIALVLLNATSVISYDFLMELM